MPITYPLSAGQIDQITPSPHGDYGPSGQFPGRVRTPAPTPMRVALALAPAFEALSEHDRSVAQALLVDGLSFRQASDRLKLPLGSMGRRRKKLVERLQDPVVLQLLAAKNQIDPLAKDIALRHLLCGQSQRHIARQLRVSRRLVNERLTFVRGWAKAACLRAAIHSAA